MTAYINKNIIIERKEKLFWKPFKYVINIFIINVKCQTSATKCYNLFRVSWV